MTEEQMRFFGGELLKKTYDDHCQVKEEWKKVNSPKIKSLYLPHFINTFEIVGENNEILFDDMLNNVKVYFHPEIMVYMVCFNQQVIYHNAHYMIINRHPSWNSYEWKKL